MKKTLGELKKKAFDIRKRVLDMCIKAGTGHVTSSMSCIDILVALYYSGLMKHDPKDPTWEKRDRFILSKGHASPALYVILADCGYFDSKELDKFAQKSGKFGVHLQNDVPGVEITSGSLGHGLGIACGLALAAKIDNKSYTIFVLLGDGECYEGSIWEAAMFASHHELNNLIAVVDRNRLCVTGFTEDIVRLNPIDKKWESFGWEAITINGHSFNEILQTFGEVHSRKRNRPLVIIANTVKGKGISFMENQPLWHGLVPKGEQGIMAKIELTKGEKA